LIAWAGSFAVLPKRLQYVVAGNRYQKLLPHFGEAGTTILTVKHLD
jgi:hypothetical protein